jgi:hypothetical protein
LATASMLAPAASRASGLAQRQAAMGFAPLISVCLFLDVSRNGFDGGL